MTLTDDINHQLAANELLLPPKVTKRDGSLVEFDLGRIERAVTLCYGSLEAAPLVPVRQVVGAVANVVAARFGAVEVPHVEQVQDIVEQTLAGMGEFEAAKHYILYREEHAKARAASVPPEVREAFELDRQFFPEPLMQFMFYDKYSRYDWERGRRETWLETVERNVAYLRRLSGDRLPEAVYSRIRDAILHMRAMPSMRSLAMAGPAAERNSMSIYNCSYLPVRDLEAFSEAMLISLAGCGVGFSVERHHVEELPRIVRQRGEEPRMHLVEDSAEGWAFSVAFGIACWFEGYDVEFDYGSVRPVGTPLKTKGGRASGPEPLKFVHDFCRAKVLSRQGSFLRTLDAHDMMCAIGGAAVSGGVRRTAMISLFSWDDEDMRTCKDGSKLDNNPVRWNANNSAVWPTGLTQMEVIDQMTEMARNRRGEPGIFSRENLVAALPARRTPAEFGQNPCGEIVLRPYQFCNLSIAVARPEDGVVDLLDKVEVATIIGTIQSLATTFPHMRPEWKQNCEEERLLGVDITGQQDCPAVQDASVLAKLKAHAVATNRRYAELLGVNPSAAVTCVKPSGNSSQLLNCSSGLHARWAPFYLRRTRVSASTPLYRVLRDAGVPMRPENGQSVDSAHTWVVAWPVRAPAGSLTRKDRTALDQCEYWLLNKLHWTEHNPSVTITYQPDELIDLTKWVWEHREVIGGMAFLPADDAHYQQPPYEEVSAEEYAAAVAAFPPIDFSLLYAYEHTDMTTAAQELACMSGACEVEVSG